MQTLVLCSNGPKGNNINNTFYNNLRRKESYKCASLTSGCSNTLFVYNACLTHHSPS